MTARKNEFDFNSVYVAVLSDQPALDALVPASLTISRGRTEQSVG